MDRLLLTDPLTCDPFPFGVTGDDTCVPFQTECWWFFEGLCFLHASLTCRIITGWFLIQHVEVFVFFKYWHLDQVWSRFQKYLRENVFGSFGKNFKATWPCRPVKSCVSTADFHSHAFTDQQSEDVWPLGSSGEPMEVSEVDKLIQVCDGLFERKEDNSNSRLTALRQAYRSTERWHPEENSNGSQLNCLF